VPALLIGCDANSDNGGHATGRHFNSRPHTFAGAIDAVQPAVFHILRRTTVRGTSQDASGASPDERTRLASQGSGVLLASNGRAITNAHVVAGNAVDTLTARLHDGRQFDFEVIGTDPHTDLAVLNLQSDGELPSATLGNSQSARVGDWVVTLGYPLGYSSTATAGIISGIGRTELPLEARDVTYQNFIQTDASVHRGGSGGALVSADTEVIGMTTATVDNAPGLSFAIPSKVIDRLLPELRTFGRVTKTWIGLFVDPVPPRVRQELDLPHGRGVLIKKIFDDGPATDSGIQPGDILMKLDGTPVDSVQQIAHVAGRLGLGRRISLVVQRGLDTKTFDIPTVPHPDVSAPDDWRRQLAPD
jgi:S1-C subfamily serine protease